MDISVKPRLIGDDIFFNFKEIDYPTNTDGNIIAKLQTEELDGVINKNVFSEKEVNEILEAVKLIPESEKLNNYVGQSFPHDFGTVTNNNERLENYLDRLATFNSLPFQKLTNRLDEFFNKIGASFKSGVPNFKHNNKETSPGNFRFLMPNKGVLFVHCGYLLQTSAEYFYNNVNHIKREGQLSFFLMLQYPEQGGELTIYDLLWKGVNKKDIFEQNKYVIDKNGEKVFLDNVKKFTVRPSPGDVVVFKGGPIWHRVEDIKGELNRITFGGFINFSEDNN